MAMSSLDVVCEEMAPVGAPGRGVAGPRLRLPDVFLLAIWCGLVSGLIEVGVMPWFAGLITWPLSVQS